jgi:hypothetical protein
MLQTSKFLDIVLCSLRGISPSVELFNHDKGIKRARNTIILGPSQQQPIRITRVENLYEWNTSTHEERKKEREKGKRTGDGINLPCMQARTDAVS